MDKIESRKLSLLKEQHSWAISILTHYPISSVVYRDWNLAATSAIEQAFGVMHSNVRQFQEASKFDINRTTTDESMRRWLEVQKSLLEAYINQLESAGSDEVLRGKVKVFLVHGNDLETRETIARFMQNLGLEPIILSEQAHQGRTIIEQIEMHTNVPFGVVLLTPDDVGEAKGQERNLKPRARQNVILELGFLMGRLGRNRVCAIRKGSVDIPSDFHGVLWTSWEKDWKIELIRELRAAGIEVDFTKI